ncbi:hypothetical protein KHP62_02740 [Rhodobacteraceae bacterium NNCM2]|nr:hypothetical protein [Coraliihabitans acroporae]
MSESGSHAGHAPQLDLLPVNAGGVATQATHVAVQGGDWFDPATWGGEIPGEGDVVQIPAGIEVTYDGASDANLFMVRVDGTLTMTAEGGGATKMVVDTMITAPGSTLNILASRATDGEVDIVFSETAANAAGFADLTDGDGVLGRQRWDPEQLSLGLVASGEVNIRGQETAGHLDLAEGARAGATTLSFDAWAEGASTWAPGDQIVVGAATYAGFDQNGILVSQDEVRTITSITHDGDRMIVHLDSPLDYDHVGVTDPLTGAELTTAVGNLTRNVTFSSAVADQNGDGLADEALSYGEAAGPLDHYATERGHVMFMHNDDITVANSAFFGLGRTDKSVDIDDYVTIPDTGDDNFNHRIYDDAGTLGEYEEGIDLAIETDPAEITNQRGRYALHIHMAGIESDEHAGHDAAGTMDAEGGVIGPCARTGDPICHCAGYDEDGDGTVDYYLHPLEDQSLYDGNVVDTDGDGVGDALRISAAEHDAMNGLRGAQITGNVVWGSPGWGIVQHDSRADLIDNVTYNVTGSAIVSETGNEVGLWQGNATFSTINARPLVGSDDADDFNDDFGHEGVGFWLAGRALEVVDNTAVSSARAGFMYRVNGVTQYDILTGELGELSDIKHGADAISAEDVPITNFTGNEVIAALEALRIITDPLDSVRKFNDAWSVMRDFTALEIANAGVSITYSSKYIFENFLLLGTEQVFDEDKSGGFFFKTSVADVTVVDSHVERFDHGVINWFSFGDRQEYRRGYWDPLDPANHAATGDYEGMGTSFGIENPAQNLWNHHLVDFTSANLNTGSKFFGKRIEIENGDGTTDVYLPREIWNTQNGSATDDPAIWRGVSIELLDDSANGGLVALWREDLADSANYEATLAAHIPLAYQDNVYLSQVHLADGTTLKRDHYLDDGEGIAEDIWSGTVLKFAKTDSLGRQVFAYGDFAPLDWDGATRAVTTNEKIIFTAEMIDGILATEGYYSSPGTPMNFVAVRSVFTDRLTGEYTVKEFLVGLDLAWEMPAGAVDNGLYEVHENSIIADSYAHFHKGQLITTAPHAVPQVVASDTPEPGDISLADALELLRDAEIDKGSTPGAYGSDAVTEVGTDDHVSGDAVTDIVDGGGGDTGSSAWLRGAIKGTEERDVITGTFHDDEILGLGGDDYLIGSAGDDAIDGGAGNDTLFGDQGDDALTGGAGRDQFRMTRTSGDDIIHDFDPEEDLLDMVRTRLSADEIIVRQVGSDVIVTYLGNELRIVDLDAQDLNDGNFLVA